MWFLGILLEINNYLILSEFNVDFNVLNDNCAFDYIKINFIDKFLFYPIIGNFQYTI